MLKNQQLKNGKNIFSYIPEESAFATCIRHKEKYFLIILILVSCMFRITYFLEMVNSPCFHQQLGQASDMQFFHSWGKQIAAGDWLSENVRQPIHFWHRDVAREFYRLHPDKIPKDGSDPIISIWEKWCGGKRFYQDPLYPYLIGLTYKLFGPKVVYVFIWQLILGVVCNVLIFLISRRFFGITTGVIAAVLAVCYGPMLFYEMTLLRSTCITFFSLLLVYLTALALSRKKPWQIILLGICAGTAVLLKAHFILFLAGLLLYLIIRFRNKYRLLLRLGLFLILGFSLAISPLLIRNITVGAPTFCTTSAGGFTFIGANTPDYPGESFYMSMKYAPGILGTVNGRLFPGMLETFRTHPNLSSYLKLMGVKFIKIWHWYEIPNNVNIYYYELHSEVLKLLLFRFVFIAPLALIGLILALRYFYRCWPLYLLLMINFTVMIFFFVMSRYRLPMALGLIPFAAFSLNCIYYWCKEKNYKYLIVTAIVLLLLFLSLMQPLPGDKKIIRPTDYLTGYKYYYSTKAGTAIINQNFAEAEYYLAAALKLEPQNITVLSRKNLPTNLPDKKLSGLFGIIHLDYADVLEKCGRNAAATKHRERGQLLMQISGMRFE